MGKRLLCGLARAMATALITAVWVSGAAAAVSIISSCGTLSTANQTYNLAGDLHAAGGDCLVVANSRITINLQGHSIVQDTPTPFGAGITDGGIARDLTVVRNGTISGFVFGIELDSSTRSDVRNVTVVENDLDGILVGDNSLVKTVTANNNGFTGILGGDGIRGKERAQIQDSEASANGANGIRVGNRCLVTGSTAEENLEDGIATGGSCTVSHNTASDNDGDGIDVGQEDPAVNGSKSTVTANLAENNFDVGIRVECPSTVSNNAASDNGQNYDLIGGNCTVNNNSDQQQQRR